MSLPDYLELEVNGRQFYLVHAFPSDKPDERIWNCPDPKAPAPMENSTVM